MTPNINLDSTALRYFQGVAEFKSVRRAAAALNVSPPGLSARSPASSRAGTSVEAKAIQPEACAT
jgi:hypothetical protein